MHTTTPRAVHRRPQRRQHADRGASPTGETPPRSNRFRPARCWLGPLLALAGGWSSALAAAGEPAGGLPPPPPAADTASTPPASRLAVEVNAWAKEPLVVASAEPAGPALLGEAAEVARLEQLPPANIPVQDAPLAAALNLIAHTAGMNYLAPTPEDFSERITLSTKTNPWRLLQVLGERYRFTLEYREGLWLFTRETSEAMISKTYILRHTNLDAYKAAQNSFNLLGSSSGAGGGDSGGGPSGGLVFTPQTQKIIDDLRELLGLPPAQILRFEAPTAGANPAAAPTVGATPAGSPPPTEATLPPSAKTVAGARPATTRPAPSGKVLYLPDANALYVTATRAQHQHVAEYLRIVDQPVAQIRIEARFFETAHDPKLVLGINPESYQPKVSLSEIATRLDLGRMRATPFPERVLLSTDTLTFQLQALQTDQRTRLVNNPTLVVANNREAYFSVGDEEPFVSLNSLHTGLADAGFGSTQAQVAIRRIGTSVNIVPTLFAGEEGKRARIRLAVRIEVGALKGFRKINSVDLPVVSSQKYEYTVYVDEGDTLAFGGLAGLAENAEVKKVPLLGDVPVVGYVFKSRDQRSSQRNLVAYITAAVVRGPSPAMPTVAAWPTPGDTPRRQP